VGNVWGACDPNEPKNNRSRCSALAEIGQTHVIIDTGPDFRTQYNSNHVPKLDAVFYSHHHADHVNGIDDLRPIVFKRNSMLPVYGNQATLADLQNRFGHMFQGGAIGELYPPLLRACTITNFDQPIVLGDVIAQTLIQDHKTCQSVGYRFGDLAYCVDFVDLDAAAVSVLRGVRTWIVDAAAYNSEQPSVHANLKTIFRLNQEVQAQTVILTSLSLAMDYHTLRKELPSGYVPAYDGMKIEFIPA
jgi:phosphoribosyl 1,2-cyclic phosphate phosphodiesterase